MRLGLLWSIIRLYLTSKTFRSFMADKWQEWAGKATPKEKTSPKAVPVPQEPREAPRRRAKTLAFHFSAPENGEERSGKTGTFVMTDEQLMAELDRLGRNPDGSYKRPE